MKRMISRLTRAKILLLVWLTSLISPLIAGHNTNRYFPFLEKPENYTFKSNNYLSISSFFLMIGRAFSRNGKSVGIPELWGTYDLNDVINSLGAVQTAQGINFVNPFLTTPGVEDLAGHPILYKSTGQIQGGGLLFEGGNALFSPYLFIGYSLPLMHIRTNCMFTLNQGSNNPNDTTDPLVKLLLPGEVNQVDRVRLSVQDQMGLEPSDWGKTGFGDLDVYLRWNNSWDHTLLIRTIDLNIMSGVVFPTGVLMAKRNPLSVPFMGDGHWGLYIDVFPEFELKLDWKVGLLTSIMFQLPETRKRRIPVFKEPTPFSALIAKTEVSPGLTFKASPYITIENLVDGLGVQARYTYLHHNDDTWEDERKNQNPPSYLTLVEGPNRTLTEVEKNIERKKHDTSWRAHYISLRICYDSASAMKTWLLSPTFFFNVDTHLTNRGVSKTNQVTFGAELHF